MIDIIQTAVIGAATGAGSAIGNYLANLMLIKHIEKIEKQIRRGLKTK